MCAAAVCVYVCVCFFLGFMSFVLTVPYRLQGTFSLAVLKNLNKPAAMACFFF